MRARLAGSQEKAIAIVGGGVAGISAAFALRELGYAGAVRVFSAEAATPYERPPLSKEFLTNEGLAIPPSLASTAALADAGIELDLGVEVVAIDPHAGSLATSVGERVRFDRLLLATGAEPRTLDIPGTDLQGIHYLRELTDARALRTVLRPGTNVAIIGGGMIGLEVAASAVALGANPTVIEVGPHVMGRIFPRLFAMLVEDLHREQGVAVMTGTGPVELTGESGHVRSIALDNGDQLATDAVVIAVGVAPRTGLAADIGLDVRDGIVVNADFRSNEERIFAAGDAARVFHTGEARHVRVEQWGPAQEQGRSAAAGILGLGHPYRDVPWMWSDQYDLHLRAAGFGFEGAEIVRRGSLHERAGLSYLGVRDGRLVAACGVSRATGVAKTIRAAALAIATGAPVAPEQLQDPSFNLRLLARTQPPRDHPISMKT